MESSTVKSALADIDAALKTLRDCRNKPEDYQLHAQSVLTQIEILKNLCADHNIEDHSAELADIYKELLYEFVFCAKSAVLRNPGTMAQAGKVHKSGFYR